MNTRFIGGVLSGGSVLVCISALAQSPKEQPREKIIASIQGPALYKAYCAVCHGLEGRGNGPMAKTLKVAPTDLTRIASRSGGKFPRMKIEQIILGEESPASASHGIREMPLWGPVFSEVGADQDLGRVRVDNLARYIEQMQGR
jgi:mono/diheme cytochrome c family protein